MADDPPFVIHSDSRITLKPEARELARMHDMTEAEFAQHLLQQHKLQDEGLIQKQGEN
jgi:hypothetical protein